MLKLFRMIGRAFRSFRDWLMTEFEYADDEPNDWGYHHPIRILKAINKIPPNDAAPKDGEKAEDIDYLRNSF